MPDDGVAAFYAEVGRRVRAARERIRDGARMTQQQLADAVGLKRVSITNLERGRQRVPAHALADIAVALGVAPGSLLPETGSGRTRGLEEVLKKHPADEKKFVLSAMRSTKKG